MILFFSSSFCLSLNHVYYFLLLSVVKRTVSLAASYVIDTRVPYFPTEWMSLFLEFNPTISVSLGHKTDFIETTRHEARSLERHFKENKNIKW